MLHAYLIESVKPQTKHIGGPSEVLGTPHRGRHDPHKCG